VSAAQHLYAELLPRIRAALPGVRFRLLLVGRDPVEGLRAAAKRDAGIELTGTVPDVRPYLRQMDVFVAPLQIGAGTKLKVLEAMASGLPVVGTDIALLGLAGQDGTHYRRANDDASFVQAVCQLAQQPDERQRMGRAARELVEASYGWAAITENLANGLLAALAERRAGAAQ
jgi:glycosyltransferase involved in cell wall biosynthesis